MESLRRHWPLEEIVLKGWRSLLQGFQHIPLARLRSVEFDIDDYAAEDVEDAEDNEDHDDAHEEEDGAERWRTALHYLSHASKYTAHGVSTRMFFWSYEIVSLQPREIEPFTNMPLTRLVVHARGYRTRVRDADQPTLTVGKIKSLRQLVLSGSICQIF